MKVFELFVRGVPSAVGTAIVGLLVFIMTGSVVVATIVSIPTFYLLYEKMFK